MTTSRGPMRFLIGASAPMPPKWKSRRWVEISDGGDSVRFLFLTDRRRRFMMGP
jgi:hypothetical protein